MTSTTIGWVMDQATSQRRIHLATSAPGLILLTVEVYGQPTRAVELDAEGVVELQALCGKALRRLGGTPEEG